MILTENYFIIGHEKEWRKWRGAMMTVVSLEGRLREYGEDWFKAYSVGTGLFLTYKYLPHTPNWKSKVRGILRWTALPIGGYEEVWPKEDLVELITLAKAAMRPQ